MKTLRKLWESVVYAGLKPAAPSQARVSRRAGGLRGLLERFLSGGAAPEDPLYLTNRTFGQKLRMAVLVAIPFLILIGVVTIGFGRYIRIREAPQQQLTPAEIAEKSLPNLDKNIQIKTNRDLEVVEARVESGKPTMVLGIVRNNTDHAIDKARVLFDLTSYTGARLGAVAADIAHVDAKSTAPFRVTVEQENAAFALVREVVLP